MQTHMWFMINLTDRSQKIYIFIVLLDFLKLYLIFWGGIL